MYEQDDVEPNAALTKLLARIDNGAWVNIGGHEVERGMAELKRRAGVDGEARKATITITVSVSVGADGSGDAVGKLKFPMPPPPKGAGEFVVDDDGQFTSGPSAEGKRGYTNAQEPARKGARA